MIQFLHSYKLVYDYQFVNVRHIVQYSRILHDIVSSQIPIISNLILINIPPALSVRLMTSVELLLYYWGSLINEIDWSM